MSKDTVIAFGPASVANVGPFYDVMGYCLAHLGDIVIAEKTAKHREVKLKETIVGPYASDLTAEKVKTEKNSVQIVGQCVWERYRKDVDFGVDLTLHKGMPTQSGLGSSAASCVASAKAMLGILNIEDTELSPHDISNWLIEGEKATAGHHYPDNVVPSYFGGFYAINRQWQQQIETERFYTVIFLDKKEKAATMKMRGVVDEYFNKLFESKKLPASKTETILNYIRTLASHSARMIDALHTKNLKTFADCMSIEEGNFLHECRSNLIPHYKKAKTFLLNNGALGCTISGSGPSIACIVRTRQEAYELKDLYQKVFDPSYWLISKINDNGAEFVDDIDQWKETNSKYHNFW